MSTPKSIARQPIRAISNSIPEVGSPAEADIVEHPVGVVHAYLEIANETVVHGHGHGHGLDLDLGRRRIRGDGDRACRDMWSRWMPSVANARTAARFCARPTATMVSASSLALRMPSMRAAVCATG